MTPADAMRLVVQVAGDVRSIRVRVRELEPNDRREILRTVAETLGLPRDALLGLCPEDGAHG